MDPTGDRIVVLIPNEEREGPSREVTLVVNWFELLRQEVNWFEFLRQEVNRAFRP